MKAHDEGVTRPKGKADAWARNPGRRNVLHGVLVGGSTLPLSQVMSADAEPVAARVNLAKVAVAGGLYASGDTSFAALTNGAEPASSVDRSRGAYGAWPRTDAQWVSYIWSQPVTTDSVDVYWWADGQGIAAPRSAKLSYWDGEGFVPIRDVQDGGIVTDRYHRMSFDRVTTDRLKLEFVGDGSASAGILQWKVWSAGPVPAFAPVVAAGIGRSLVVGGQTFLTGKADWLQRRPGDAVRWTKASGPGRILFADAAAPATRATATAPGDYVLRLSATGQGQQADATIALHVAAPPPAKRLDVVYTTPYAIHSPLWNARAKSLIVNWIPHCIAYCERTDLQDGQGGIDNFVEAGKALRGEAHAPHKGYVFSNAGYIRRWSRCADATRGQVALRYGPLVYNVERADQRRIDLPIGDAPLVPEWRDAILGGVVAIRGSWSDGSMLTAVPNFARMNRTDRPIHEFPGRSGVEYAPGTVSAGGVQQTVAKAHAGDAGPVSRVWITRGTMAMG